MKILIKTIITSFHTTEQAGCRPQRKTLGNKCRNKTGNRKIHTQGTLGNTTMNKPDKLTKSEGNPEATVIGNR